MILQAPVEKEDYTNQPPFGGDSFQFPGGYPSPGMILHLRSWHFWRLLLSPFPELSYQKNNQNRNSAWKMK